MLVDYAGADVADGSIVAEFVVTYEEIELQLHLGGRDQHGLEWAQLLRRRASLEGVSLRVTEPVLPGQLPNMELFNGSVATISLHNMGGSGIVRLDGVDVKRPEGWLCWQGVTIQQLSPGQSIVVGVAALSGPRVLEPGRYRATLEYGVNEDQLPPSRRTGRTREASTEFEVPRPR